MRDMLTVMTATIKIRQDWYDSHDHHAVLSLVCYHTHAVMMTVIVQT